MFDPVKNNRWTQLSGLLIYIAHRDHFEEMKIIIFYEYANKNTEIDLKLRVTIRK